MMQVATFRVQNHLFGVDVTDVQEVMRHHEMTPVPLAKESVRGLMHLRGQIIPALDLRQILDFPVNSDGSPMNVVLKLQDDIISMLVDEICDVLEVDQQGFEPIPARIPRGIRSVLQTVCKLPEELLLILDPNLVVREGQRARG